MNESSDNTLDLREPRRFFSPWSGSFFTRPAVVIALLLGFYAPIKILWEQQIANTETQLRYRGVRITAELRDRLSQGVMISLLAGLRGVVADYYWRAVTEAWTNQEWTRVKSGIDLATTLQPRSIMFWDMGGWHLAWNASVDKRYDKKEPNEARRIKEEHYWIDEGRKVFERGIENNPDHYNLYFQLGMLYEQKLKDFRKAAEYYKKASEFPDAPVYVERFPGYAYEKGGDLQEALDYFKTLWNRPGPKTEKAKAYDKIESKIRSLEKRLNVPKEKRVFP